jgi:hypothetical protein
MNAVHGRELIQAHPVDMVKAQQVPIFGAELEEDAPDGGTNRVSISLCVDGLDGHLFSERLGQIEIASRALALFHVQPEPEQNHA